MFSVILNYVKHLCVSYPDVLANLCNNNMCISFRNYPALINNIHKSSSAAIFSLMFFLCAVIAAEANGMRAGRRINFIYNVIYKFDFYFSEPALDSVG